MTSLLQRVQESIRKHRLFPPGQRILVAVSGGVDSMVLLDTLQQLSKENRWPLTLAHLNHQLRGRSSDADERLVRRTAQRLALAVVVERADVRAFAGAHNLSMEMAAREVRHTFFARTAKRLKISVVVLAHHADDQLELFFLRLLRGSGSEGLAGMKWRNPSPYDPEVELARPLLDEPKAVLRGYAVERKLQYREDVSNASQQIQRNRVRHQLLPLLKREYQPALERTILRVMDLIGAEGDVVTRLARVWLDKARSPKSKVQSPKSHRAEGGGQRTEPFEMLPLAVQRRCLQLQLLEKGVAGDFELIEQLRLSPDRPICIGSLAREKRTGSSSGQKPANDPAGTLSVFRDTAGYVHVQPATTARFKPGSVRVGLRTRVGRVSFDGLTVHWEIQSRKRTGHAAWQPGKEFFDANKVGSPILLRHWHAGDRFQPIGLSCPLKLQDFFTNEKVPRRLRHELVLAATPGGEIFWVEGMRIADRFKLTRDTKRLLQWTWERR